MAYSFRLVRSEQDWRNLHDIRRRVLFTRGRKKLAYDENHPDDCARNKSPYVLYRDEEPIGVTRLDWLEDAVIVRLVAVIESQQRRGHGRALDHFVEIEARRRGVSKLLVFAAPDAVGFYEKVGWTRFEWANSHRERITADSVQMMKLVSPGAPIILDPPNP